MLRADERPHGCRTLPLDVDHLDRSASVPVDLLGRPLRDQDLAGLARFLQPARQVHGVPPHVVGELPFTDDAGDDRSAGDPTPHPDRVSGWPPHHVGPGHDLERHPDGCVGVVGLGDGRAHDRHVGVTDRLDLLEAVPVGKLVEPAEEGVECGRELLRRGAGGLFGGPDGVDEDDADVVERIGDPLTGRGFEPVDHGLGQDVQQQDVGPDPLLVQFSLAKEELACEHFHPVGGETAQGRERDEVQRREHLAHIDDVPSGEGVGEIHRDADQRGHHDEDEPQAKQRVREGGDQDDAHVAVLRRQRPDLRRVVDPDHDARDDDREGGPFPDTGEEAGVGEGVAEDQHRDEHTEPDLRVQLELVQHQHVRPQEDPPPDPQGDPSQEREADIAEVELKAILPERRLEGGVAEAQAETREALPH